MYFYTIYLSFNTIYLSFNTIYLSFNTIYLSFNTIYRYLDGRCGDVFGPRPPLRDDSEGSAGTYHVSQQ
jgi:hypothetical protein